MTILKIAIYEEFYWSMSKFSKGGISKRRGVGTICPGVALLLKKALVLKNNQFVIIDAVIYSKHLLYSSNNIS